MTKSVDPRKLGQVIAEQLKFYHEDIVEKVDAVGLRAIKKLVEETALTAPRRTGAFRRAITYKKVAGKAGNCATFIWGVKAPYRRLTHLLVKGHPTSTGGRTKGDPFLENAMEKILPEYEKDVEEALQDVD